MHEIHLSQNSDRGKEAMPFSNVVLLPDQMEIVQRVFRTIISELWFDRNMENEHALAALIVRAFHTGLILESDLHQHCETAAKERFAIGHRLN